MRSSEQTAGPEILQRNDRHPEGTAFLVKVPSERVRRGYDLVDVIFHANGAVSTKSANRLTTTGMQAVKFIRHNVPGFSSQEGMREAKREVDFGDENEVLAEMSRALDVEADELVIMEDDGLTSFRTGTVYEVSLGRKEWRVVENEDQERELALEVVKQDLEQEPEIFNKDFIERHINPERLRKDLWSDVFDMRYEDLTDMAERSPDDFWREWEREGLGDSPEEDEDGELPQPSSKQIEELAERTAEEQLRDPMSYLEDIYGNEAAAQAIKIAGIDIDAAAEEAVDSDGPAHFLAHYDGKSHTTESGLVYWRTN
jgi:hypothetical protein